MNCNNNRKNNVEGKAMWWKKVLAILLMYQLSLVPTLAQIEVDDEDLEEEDETELIDENDEITLTDKEGNEEVIDFPASMTYELDSLMHIYMTGKYLSGDKDCRMTEESPYFPPEVYKDRLRRLPTAIEMPYNEVVQTFIDRYTSRLRRTVSYILGASNFYMPTFEEALDAYQLPLELKYLPVIESALHPKAVSPAGATGIWQFMLATGKRYGLNVNSYVDDRCDPVKASYAAAKFLSDLYKVFGDWHLVIAAYNCGPENINKAIHRANGERDYWKIYPYLPRETRGYVPAFIAANYIMTYYCEHGICPMRFTLPEKTDTIMVSDNVHLRQVSDVLGVDMEMLRSLNPSYRRDVVPGATELSAIRLPLQDVGRFIDMQDSIFNERNTQLIGKRLEVEIAADIAPVTSVKATKRGRAAKSSKKLSKRERARQAKQARNARGGRSVTVKRGQTLSQIARANGTTVAKLKKLNGIRGNNIQAGKKLKVK